MLTTKWPVLTYGRTPRFDPARWRFRCFGLVEEEVSWTWEELLALPRAEVVCDIHCVTHWSRLDNRFEGVPIREIIERVRPKAAATAVKVHADPDYTTNLTLDELANDDVLLALKHDGQDLAPDHGGPLRLLVPKLYFWKSAKWLRGLEFLDVNPPGFWEVNGYHMRGNPWEEERDPDQETRAMQQMRAEAAARSGFSRQAPLEIPRLLFDERAHRAGEGVGLVSGHGVACARHLDEAAIGQRLDHPLGDLRGEDVARRAAHDQRGELMRASGSQRSTVSRRPPDRIVSRSALSYFHVSPPSAAGLSQWATRCAQLGVVVERVGAPDELDGLRLRFDALRRSSSSRERARARAGECPDRCPR